MAKKQLSCKNMFLSLKEIILLGATKQATLPESALMESQRSER